MNLKKSVLPLLAASLLLAGAGPAGAVAIPKDGALDFSVIRDGDKIGRQELTFTRSGNEIDVAVKTRIAVKVAFITVYRFEHDSHEVWKNGALVSLRSKTDDDGTDHVLRVSATGHGSLRVVSDGKESSLRAGAIPASLWNPAFIQSKYLMDSLVGKPLAIKVALVGTDTVKVRGRPVQARHYSMTGELARELWYDANGILVRMTLKGKDGSDILYRLN